MNLDNDRDLRSALRADGGVQPLHEPREAARSFPALRPGGGSLPPRTRRSLRRTCDRDGHLEPGHERITGGIVHRPFNKRCQEDSTSRGSSGRAHDNKIGPKSLPGDLDGDTKTVDLETGPLEDHGHADRLHRLSGTLRQGPRKPGLHNLKRHPGWLRPTRFGIERRLRTGSEGPRRRMRDRETAGWRMPMGTAIPGRLWISARSFPPRRGDAESRRMGTGRCLPSASAC
jgi:hypothetical protein